MNFQHTLLLSLATTLPLANSLRAAESVQDAFRRGLLAEETTRDLKAAAEAYSEAVRLSADQRAIEATALFRLAECQKKLGNPTEATTTLQRLAREYPEQRELLAKIPANPQSKPSFELIDLAVLSKLKAKRDAAVSEYNEKVEEIASLTARNEQLRRYEGVAFAARVPAEYSNPELPRLSAEINQATIRRTSFGPDFGPQHPEVLRVDATIKALNQLMAEQKAAVLEKIDADLNQRMGQMKQLHQSAIRLREEMDQEEAKIKAQEDFLKSAAVPSAGATAAPSIPSGNPGQTAIFSEADLRSQIDSLSVELEVLQKLPDAAEQGRFIVSRHREQTSEEFRREVNTWAGRSKTTRTNQSWVQFESLVQVYMRPLEDRLRFAKMELEALQKQIAERAPWNLVIFGEVGRPGVLQVERGQKLTVSQALMMSGGPTPMADLKKVMVRRKSKDGKEETIRVSVDRVLNQGETSSDLILDEGDRIVVGRSSF